MGGTSRKGIGLYFVQMMNLISRKTNFQPERVRMRQNLIELVVNNVNLHMYSTHFEASY